MTSSEAAQILQKPRFGSQVCIDAIEVMRMAEELLHARQWAKRKGLKGKFTDEYFGCIDTTTPVAAMEHFRIENEIDYWVECGWRPSHE